MGHVESAAIVITDARTFGCAISCWSAGRFREPVDGDVHVDTAVKLWRAKEETADGFKKGL